jgi:hypothetical protein
MDTVTLLVMKMAKYVDESKIFNSRRFQRFHFGAQFDHTYQYLSKNQVERRKDDINAYNRLKNDKSVVVEDDSVYYYLVCSRWMDKWRKFANGERDQPGTIENKVLARKIMNQR